jgi:muramoyltetrapeptide carboxypeptidase
VSSILRPKALRPGDTVAVAALSGGLEAGDASQFERGVEAIRQMGFDVHVSPLVESGRHWWWSAARPDEIAEELNRLLRDPKIRAIFALVGGRTTLSYLDMIDYEAVRLDPKPVIGFSDVDALHLALYSQTGLVSVHGDLVLEGFANRHDASDSRRQALADIYSRVLIGVTAPGVLPPGGQWERWRSGRAQGPLVGGLLNRLILVQATPYALAPDRFDGAILFWEELATSFAAIWNSLHALRYAGALDRIAGMIVGTVTNVTPSEGGPETLREVVLDVLGNRDIPVLANVDIGHNPPNIPLPLGVLAEVDADALTLTLLEAAVSPRAS